MIGRSIALYLHILGAITLFVAAGVVQLGGSRVRGASTLEELRTWLKLVGGTQGMFAAGFFALLATGLYLAYRGFTYETSWIVVGLASLILMAVLGGAVAGRTLAGIGRAAGGTGPIPPELRLRILSPTPWAAGTAANGMGLGVVWLMVNKPGWAESLGVVIALGVLGALIGRTLATSGTRAA